jgi:cobalt-zinc-cadmium resistance protein CzcA
MLTKIIRFSVNNSTFVILLTAAVIIAGIFSYNVIPIDAVPDITNVQVQVNTAVPAMTPDMVESNVTYPVENALASIPGAVDVRSLSMYGLSQVTVIFSDGTEIYRARQLIQERLQSVELPDGVKPALGPVSTGLSEIVHYTIEADTIETDPRKRNMQMMKLRTIQEWDVIPRLLNVKGVAEVNTIGGYPLQYHVIPDIHKMSAYGIRFEDISKALLNNNYNTGGGYIKQTSEQMLVQGTGLLKSDKEIISIPVKMLENYNTVTIGEIARVRPGEEIRTGAALIDGKEGIVGTVMMLMGENSRDVAIRVSERITEINGSLPEGVNIRTLYSRSELVDMTLSTVQKNLLFGALLVIIVLFLLIGNARAALITAATIPVSFLGTIIFMKITGISVSLMSLGALDFGIIIDGAVIVIDSCIRKVNEKSNACGRTLTRDEVKETVIVSSASIRQAAGFGQLIVVIVFIPIMALSGIEGRMFRPMAVSFCFAMFTAFILSFTLIPSLAGMILSGKPSSEKTYFMHLIHKIYEPLLNTAFKYKRYFLTASLMLIAAASVMFSLIGAEFIPRLNEGSLSVQFIRPLTINAEMALKLEELSHKIIMEFPEVKTVFGRMGTPEVTVHPAGIYHGDTVIMLHPQEKRPAVNGRQRTIEELSDAISDKLTALIPGQRLMMSQPIELRFNELLEGVKSDIHLKIYGDDMEKLEEYSREAAEIIQKIEGSGEVEAELRGRIPMLQIIPAMDKLKRYGISKSEVLQTVKIALAGEEAGHLYEGVKRFPIVIRLSDSLRYNIDSIKNIPVSAGENFTVPLASVAEVRISEMYGSISREASKRRAAVMINPGGRDTGSFAAEAKDAVNKNIKLPAGYYTDWGGNFKNLETAKARLMFIAPVCLMAVFFMIYSAFKSFRLTLLIFLCVPFALSGGIFSLTIMGLPFSMSAAVGFIALSGIAVLHSLVLVSCFNQLKASGESGIQLIKNGTEQRLRPVMMTALTDIFGFLPMMLAAGAGSEVQKPLAAVVVGGIITSTIITLLIIPVLYTIIERDMRD